LLVDPLDKKLEHMSAIKFYLMAHSGVSQQFVSDWTTAGNWRRAAS
jgi:hypothetical protein